MLSIWKQDTQLSQLYLCILKNGEKWVRNTESTEKNNDIFDLIYTQKFHVNIAFVNRVFVP